jgi:hypothetical protein
MQNNREKKLNRMVGEFEFGYIWKDIEIEKK